MTTPPDYVADVRGELGDLPDRAIAEALADLATAVTDLRASGGDPAVVAALGTPQAYAAELRTALTGLPEGAATDPQACVLGVPLDARGPVDAHARSRVWDPAEPRLLVPRLAGVGWRLNYGAVAVRLGLLRPDDYDDEVLDRIPSRTLAAARAVPVAIAAAGAGAVALSWRHLPDQVPTHWDWRGRPRRWSGKTSLLAVLALGAGPAAWAQRATTTEDTLVRASLATPLATVATAIVGVTLADAHARPGDPGHGNAAVLAAFAAPVLGFGQIYLPVRAGLAATWRAWRRRG